MYKESKIVITGGTGFLGHHLAQALVKRDYRNVMVLGQSDYDLGDAEHVQRMFEQTEPDVLFHLAAVCGGIGANRNAPADFWYENLLMGMNILKESSLQSIKKIVFVGTTCSYPKVPKTIPFVEDELYAGYPEETNAPYGIAKRCLLVGADAYRRQYGIDIVSAIPTNLYGPYDHFDLERSHVIPALVRKFYEAKMDEKKSVMLWGTGKATRDFVYAGDVAEGLVMLAESTQRIETPINFGSGKETSIRRLANIIAATVEYEGEIVWDATKPDGQPRRVLDTSRAKEILDWKATTEFAEGIRRTYEYFKSVCVGSVSDV